MGRILTQSVPYTRMFYLGQTSLTPSITLSKAAAAFQNPAGGAQNATEVANGWYYFALQAADTDTLGELAYYFSGGTPSPDFCDEIVPSGVITDPWSTIVPGSYASNSAGGRIGGALTNTTAILDSTTLNAIADALLHRLNGIETGITPQGALQVILAAAAGKVAISGNTVTVRDINDLVNRIIADTDLAGQRLSVTHNP